MRSVRDLYGRTCIPGSFECSQIILINTDLAVGIPRYARDFTNHKFIHTVFSSV